MESLEKLLSEKGKIALMRKKALVTYARELGEIADVLEKDLPFAEVGDKRKRIDLSNDKVFDECISNLVDRLSKTREEVEKRVMIGYAKTIINEADISREEKQLLTEQATKLILDRYEGGVKGESELPIYCVPSDPNGRGAQVDQYSFFALTTENEIRIGFHLVRKGPGGPEKSKDKQKRVVYKTEIP